MQDYKLVTTISPEQAHEVAMQAAISIAHLAMNSGAVENVGTSISKAYLQAYKAVEGWTKPPIHQIARQNNTRTIADQLVCLKIGECVDILIVSSGERARITANEEAGFTVSLNPQEA